MIPFSIEFEAKALLGEGPCWDAANNVLHWVDIERFELHTYDPTTKQDRAIKLEQHIGAAVVRASGGFVVALRDGIYHLDPATKALTLLSSPESHLPDNRFNDGKCDPQGRFWAGTMNLPEVVDHQGSLYCLNTQLEISTQVTGVTVSNGLAWSADEKTMYYSDSPTRAISAFDFDATTGNVSNRRVCINIPEGYGYPDGLTIDAEGMLWIALWDGWRVCRFNPNNGELLAEIKLPVARPTSCVFGGANLDNLYITSASTRLAPEALAAQPLAGSIFVAQPGVQGTATYQFLG